MATSIQIKRSPNVTAPSTVDLLEGELAYSYDKDNNGAGAKLYIEVLDSGSSETIHTIGGKYYTAKVDAATSAATASTLVQRDSFGSLAANNISLTGNVSLGGTKLSGGGSGFFVDPIVNNTSGNVVYYNPVTKELTYGTAGTASSASALATPRNITLSGDLQGNVFFDGSQDVTIVANVISNSVALGTDTTGIYVANVIPGAGLTGSGFDSEGATPTIALATSGVTANTYGGGSKIPVITVDAYGRITSAANVAVAGVSSFSASGNVFTISTADGGSFTASIQENSVRLGTDTTGVYVANLVQGTGVTLTNLAGEGATPTIALAASGVTAATYGSASSVSQVVVDTYGRVTSASNVSIAIPSSALTTDVALGTQTSGAYVANLVAGTGISISGLGNEGTTPTITNSGVTGITGTANEVEVSASTGSITIGLPNNVTIGNDLTVSGNLNILGTATTVNSTTLNIADPLIYLAGDNYSSDLVDIGFVGNYYDGSSQRHAGLFRDASDSGKFKLFYNLQPEPTSTINTGNASFSIATLVASVTGGTVSGLTANIVVSDGGTGRGTLTTNAILYGQGTSAVGLATGSAYQVLQLNASGVPVFAGIDGGTY